MVSARNIAKNIRKIGAISAPGDARSGGGVTSQTLAPKPLNFARHNCYLPPPYATFADPWLRYLCTPTGRIR